MMKLSIIIQSRMSSKRYPGKMLSPFLGKPVFTNVVDRLKSIDLNAEIILVTSREITDDPLAIYGQHLGLKIIRGPLEDVMSRFILALKKHSCDAFFRVCGDSPLLIPSLYKSILNSYNKGEYDIVTNVFPRTFPSGMSVELIKTSTFLETEKKITNKEDREHITKYFYENHSNFKIFNINSRNKKYANLKLSLDYPEDLQRLEDWYYSSDIKMIF